LTWIFDIFGQDDEIMQVALTFHLS